MNMLEKIQFQLEYLSKLECKVVEVILVLFDNVIYLSIAVMVLEVNVSELMVNCFCCSMDMCGFFDFKFYLVQSLVNGIFYVNCNVNEDDSVELYIGKIFEFVMVMFDYVCYLLDKFVINCVVDLFIQVKKIVFFGLGFLVVVVYDVMNKFFCFNVLVVYFDDIVL